MSEIAISALSRKRAELAGEIEDRRRARWEPDEASPIVPPVNQPLDAYQTKRDFFTTERQTPRSVSSVGARICIQTWKTTIMPTLKLHYEGWVSLPAVLRQQLGLNSGDRLDVDLVDGTIVLRPAATTKRPAPREDQAAVIDSPARTRPRH